MSDNHSNSTVVTRVSAKRDSTVQALMSYTAVTTHREMASAFINEILKFSARIMPDHKLNIEDLITICHAALDRQSEGVTVLEGRHLRGRITDQLSRARRYKEPFSIIVLKLIDNAETNEYEAIVDTLCERMRQTDMLFSFKKRIVLLLPHTQRDASLMLVERIRTLIQAAIPSSPIHDMAHFAFPSPEITKSSQVLDWAEDQLR